MPGADHTGISVVFKKGLQGDLSIVCFISRNLCFMIKILYTCT